MTMRCLRPLGEIENGFVGEIRTAGRCPGIGGSAGVDPVAITKRRARISNSSPTDDRAAVLEFGVALDHPHAEPGETLRRVDRRDGGDHALHVIVHLGEIDRRRAARHAEGARAAHELGALGRRQQRLRRHAAGVEAIAAHLVPLDQHHRHAESTPRRRRPTGRRSRRRSRKCQV